MVNTKTKKNIKPTFNLNFQPFYIAGLIIILFLSPLLRGLYFRSEALSMMIVVAITFLFCLGDQALRKEPFIFNQPVDWAMAAMLAAFALSLVTAVQIGSAIHSLMVVVCYLMVYLMGIQISRHEKAIDLLIATIYLTGVLVALIGITSATGIFVFPGAYADGAINSTLQYKNALAIYLVAINIIGLAMSVRTSILPLKILLAMANTLIVIVILGTQSRGGWIIYPAAVALFIMLIPYTHRWRAAYHLFIFLGAGLITSRLFFDGLKQPQVVQLYTYLIIGLLTAGLLQVGYHFLGRWLNREQVEESTRRLVAVGGISYLLVVCIIYLFYAASALPSAANSIVSVQTSSRMQSISGTDVSFQGRLTYYRDALKIIKDHVITGAGGGGWNALYHQYADKLYWSTETHNYFLQTWIETGTIGFLVLLGVWIFLFLLVKKSHGQEREDSQEIVLWGLAAASASLIIHSIFDFELSIPAVGILLYFLVGIIRGMAGSNENAMNNVTISNWQKLLPAVLGVILALSLVVTAYRFDIGDTDGSIAAAALTKDDTRTAVSYYQQAIKLDPLTASYYSDLAQIIAVSAINNDDAIARYQAIALAKKAARLEPYNVKVRSSLMNLYVLLGERELVLTEASALVKANPFDMVVQEAAARTRIENSVYYLAQGDKKKAKLLVKLVQTYPQNSLVNDKTIHEPMKLYLAQSAYLQGQYQQSWKLLEPLLKTDSTINQTTLIWAAASSTKLGYPVKAAELLQQIPKANQTQAAEAYKQLLNLSVL